jgi:pimeloyl-ACP methyl ester carboxylesterase
VATFRIGSVETTQIDGLQIRFARTGRADGISVLLTSPWPESIYAFRDVLFEIGKLNPLIAIDLPGYGRSEARPDVGTPALLFAAARRPTVFESLVVGSGATSPELAAGHLKDLIASPPGALADADGGEIGAGFVVANAKRKTPRAVLEDYRLSSAGRRFEDATNFVRAYTRDLPRLKELLRNIETPVLIIAGEHDPIVPPPNGQLLADHIPHSRYTLLEGGHLIWEDAPEEYAANVVSWLKGGYRSV